MFRRFRAAGDLPSNDPCVHGDSFAPFKKDKKITELVHADNLTSSPARHPDHCVETTDRTEQRLLPAAFNVEFPLSADSIQDHLDFGSRDRALFHRYETGEDRRRVLCRWHRAVERIRERVYVGRAVLERTLMWSDGIGWK